METLTMERARRALADLNAQFHGRTLLGQAFYEQLVQAGFVVTACVLASIFPDGGNTHCGTLVRQDGRVFEFDVDLDDAGTSTWRDVTDAFHQALRARRLKPWSAERLAYEAHLNGATSPPEDGGHPP